MVEVAIDMDLARLSQPEIEGAYRSLCGAMLLRAAQELGVTKRWNKGAVDARRVTRNWLFQDRGLITFGEACSACDISRRRFLDGVVNHADGRAEMRASFPQPERWVFGRRIHASEA